jgi:hypothetical protein
MARKYIAAIYDNVTQVKLRNWCTENGFDLGYGYGGEPKDPNEYEFHTTVFYTMNDVGDLREGLGYRLIESHPVTPIGFTMLGLDKNVPVLKLDFTGMIAHLRQKYDVMGFKDQWDQYQPHISLSYAKKPVDFSTMSLPTFDIRFDRVKIEDLVD